MKGDTLPKDSHVSESRVAILCAVIAAVGAIVAALISASAAKKQQVLEVRVTGVEAEAVDLRSAANGHIQEIEFLKSQLQNQSQALKNLQDRLRIASTERTTAQAEDPKNQDSVVPIDGPWRRLGFDVGQEGSWEDYVSKEDVFDRLGCESGRTVEQRNLSLPQLLGKRFVLSALVKGVSVGEGLIGVDLSSRYNTNAKMRDVDTFKIIKAGSRFTMDCRVSNICETGWRNVFLFEDCVPFERRTDY